MAEYANKISRRKCRKRIKQAQEALIKAKDWLTAGANAAEEYELSRTVRSLAYSTEKILREIAALQAKLQKENMRRMNEFKFKASGPDLSVGTSKVGPGG